MPESVFNCTSARHVGRFDCLTTSLNLNTMDNGRGHFAWWQFCKVPNHTQIGTKKQNTCCKKDLCRKPAYATQASVGFALHWRHNDHDGVSNHQHYDCLLNRLFGHRSKKTLKLRVTGLCVGNTPGRGKCFHLMTSLWSGSWQPSLGLCSITWNYAQLLICIMQS